MYENLKINRSTGKSAVPQIEGFLENLICSGQLKVGTRLPSTLKLTKCWKVNLISVQKAMERLSAKGLIKRKSNVGTFVKNRIAGISIGIISGLNLINEDSHYYRNIVESLRQEIIKRNWNVFIYDALNEYLDSRDSNKSNLYEKLKRDIESDTWQNCLLIGTGEWTLKELGIKDSINCVRINQVYQLTDIIYDYAYFARESINWCVRNRLKKIFFLDFFSFPEAVRGINEAVTDNKLRFFPEMHSFNLTNKLRNEKTIFEQTQVLIDNWKKNHNLPDALIVSDDITMRSVAMALMKKKIKIPGQMEIIVMANEGVDLVYGIPVNRFVFRSSEKANKAVDLLRTKISGNPLPELPILIKGKIFKHNNK